RWHEEKNLILTRSTWAPSRRTHDAYASETYSSAPVVVTAHVESATPDLNHLARQPAMTARDGTTLDRLFETIEAHGHADPASSYTASLLRRGTEHVAKKLGEEAIETALAAVAGRRAAVVSESA